MASKPTCTGMQCSILSEVYRASKSPDLAGDLPIFDKIMKISRSPDLECKSPALLQEALGYRSRSPVLP